uniref:Uncharacterized protein n=1 Tax=Physcomitrium patens TaxID=3218 RepID=A0A2K1LBN6_PHYPA|nr:hypothetical protein PHYPA_001865 [Physcomitrium patens]
MPCRSTGDGNWELVTECEVDDYLYERIKKSEDELIAEKKCVAYLTGGERGICNFPDGGKKLLGDQ